MDSIGHRVATHRADAEGLKPSLPPGQTRSTVEPDCPSLAPVINRPAAGVPNKFARNIKYKARHDDTAAPLRLA